MLFKKEKETIPKNSLEHLVFKQHFSYNYKPDVLPFLERQHGKDLVHSLLDSYKKTIEFRKTQIEEMKIEFENINKFFFLKHSKNPIKRVLKSFYFKKKMRVDYEEEFLSFWAKELECSPSLASFFMTNCWYLSTSEDILV